MRILLIARYFLPEGNAPATPVYALAQGRSLARRLGASGCERIAKRYDYDVLCQDYPASLDRLAAGRKPH